MIVRNSSPRPIEAARRVRARSAFCWRICGRASGDSPAFGRGVFRRTASALLFAAVAAATSAACGSETSTSVNTPTTVRCQPTLAPSASAYSSTGGTGTLNISVARDCAWSASSQAAWIVITSGREGQGDGSVAYRIDGNGDPVARRGALAVGDARIELAQEAAPCRYQVSAPADPVASEGG